MTYRTTYFINALPSNGDVPPLNPEVRTMLESLGVTENFEPIVDSETTPTVQVLSNVCKISRDFQTQEQAQTWLEFVRTREIFISGTVTEI